MTDDHSEFFVRDEVEVLAVHKIGAWVPLSTEVAEDLGCTTDWARNEMKIFYEPFVGLAISRGLDRMMNPWKYPDNPQWPKFVLTPRLDWWVDLPGRVSGWYASRRQRVRVAFNVLRGRDYESDSDYSG